MNTIVMIPLPPPPKKKTNKQTKTNPDVIGEEEVCPCKKN
jgi:hypothetical protein